MKIKELHIRNIASIERADIDFEKDIIDPLTGLPSNIFLIAGDTGTGKTVILDAIAMALYKTTPRIEDVPTKQKNEFTDNEGREISINRIEQYTRLGISEKDDCYSELAFEGNDGRSYGAKLELGVYKSRTDENGARPLKYSSPKWYYKIGADDWQKVDAKGQILVDAIGLSFEQFKRMAMLAQGQFAAFLTGKKEERESILEQLTSTSRFSAYGAAISSLFSKAKNAKEAAETVYETQKKNALPPEELQRHTETLSSLRLQKEALDKEYRKKRAELDIVDDIEDFRCEGMKAEMRQRELEAVMAGDEYQQKKQLVSDWDSTNRERQWLTDQQNAAKRKAAAEAQLAVAKETFARLSADLVHRDIALRAIKGELTQLNAWLKERESQDELFTQAGAIEIQLGQFADNAGRISETKQLQKQEKEKTQTLVSKSVECKKAVDQAKALLEEKQKGIDQLQAQRTAMNPTGIASEKDAASQRKHELEILQQRIGQQEEMRRVADQTRHEISSDEAALQRLKAAYDASQSLYEQRAREESSTRSLLSAMQMSVEETLVELRRKMHDSHAETCPLCGQPIEASHLPDDFQHILSPIQQREDEAKHLLDVATRQRDNDKSEFDKANGALASKQRVWTKSCEAIAKEEQEIERQATQLSLDGGADLASQIAQAIGKENDRIAKLAEQQAQAEALQAAINRLIEEKKPLDKAEKRAEQELSEASTDVELNRTRLNDFEKNIAALEEDQNRLAKALSSLLSAYYPAWSEDVSTARQQLKRDAEAYLGQKLVAEKKGQEAGRLEALLDSIKDVSSTILANQTDWTLSEQALEYKAANINQEWTQLYAQIEHQQQAIKEAVSTQHETSQALSSYYAASGRTEQDLMALLGQEGNIAEARSLVEEKNGQRKSNSDAIALATKRISDLLKELKVEKMEEVPEKESLQVHVEELANGQQALAAQIGGIEEKLNAHKQNERKAEEARLELDRQMDIFGRWDRLNHRFGGTRFRTLVQSYILRPLLNNANIYLEKITDRYKLTCSDVNEQLSILVLDRYNKNQVRSATVLSGGERFMISLALSLALSSLNRQDMNVNILFIDEGFGTLDETNLNSVMSTLEKLQEIAGQSNRRVGIISHREELLDRIPSKINVRRKGEGRSIVVITNE